MGGVERQETEQRPAGGQQRHLNQPGKRELPRPERQAVVRLLEQGTRSVVEAVRTASADTYIIKRS